jgi:hypothetical protein
MGSRTRDEWFDVDVAFVDREQQVFCTILGGDGKTAYLLNKHLVGILRFCRVRFLGRSEKIASRRNSDEG